MEKIVTLVKEEKFEDAALVRDRMHALEDGVHRSSRLREITAIPLVIAAQANALGGWEIHAISHGRFAGAIAPDQPGPALRRQARARAVEDGAPAEAHGKAVDRQHGRAA